MKTKALITVTMLLLLITPIFADTATPVKPVFSGGAVLGYNSGFKMSAYGMVSNFAQGFPMNLRMSLGYAFVQPGNATDARRIFINNNTNGTPEDNGRIFDFRMDLMYPIKVLSLKQAYITGGPRYAKFKGNFKFVGGNEDFDVTSDQWGIGSGIESYFPMSNRVNFVVSGGLDYFFESKLVGHDTSYSPDGEIVNQREDYTYNDADGAIDQPKIEFSVMLGFNYNF